MGRLWLVAEPEAVVEERSIGSFAVAGQVAGLVHDEWLADRTGRLMPVALLNSPFAALDEQQRSSAKLGASAALRTAPSSGA
ncbi:hypothetical protein M2368_003730 [Arthrobacter sp. JUb119]|uniref:hypothetical protein n=1 Tax=Micrococcaceae TaxID=1268 RepID=UPI0014152C1B|nr:hypothetical protein [Arthrobacter sp. JUb115]MCS3494698.1 hypothetical protein [Arthrobacter sp. JUb119]